jgi:hypothetical protein
MMHTHGVIGQAMNLLVGMMHCRFPNGKHTPAGGCFFKGHIQEKRAYVENR